MIPQLTETWGAAYLQVLIALLVFTLGIPALIYQLAVPDEIRRILHRRHESGAMWHFTIVATVFVSLIFVWFLHPYLDSVSPRILDYAAVIYMTIILILILVYWRVKLSGHTRETLIHSLSRQFLRDFDDTGNLNESIISDLSYLGEHGKPGDEKQIVIDALADLAVTIHTSQAYKGNKLEPIINSMRDICGNIDNLGSERNFLSVCEILEKILDNLRINNLSTSLDAFTAISILRDLGIISTENKSESVALAFLESNKSESMTIFNMALIGLRKKKYSLALASHNKLETLVEQSEELIINQDLYNLLGLIAEFNYEGVSTQRRALLFLSRIKNAFKPSFVFCLNSAYEHHYNIANYETADKLHKMMREYLDGKIVL
jgi:hypothetical protein